MSIYVIDNNALIRLQYMPPRAIPSVWSLLEKLAIGGRLVICKAIWDENKNEELKPWFEERKAHFHRDYTIEQFECLSVIGEYCPDFVDPQKPGSDADQPLVAYAMSLNDESHGVWESGPAIIVTFEKRSQRGSHRLKVPDACDFFGIECIDLYEMIEREGPI